MNSKSTLPEAPASTETPPATPKPKAPRKAKAKTAKAKKPGLTLADLAKAYNKHLEDSDKSPGTVLSYTAELKLACRELGSDTAIASITPEQVETYYTCDRVTKLRSGRPKAPASIAKTRRVLRLAFCYAVESGWLDKLPLPPSEATF